MRAEFIEESVESLDTMKPPAQLSRPPLPPTVPGSGSGSPLPPASVTAQRSMLVAVGPSPHSEQLVRWTGRQSTMLKTPWAAVHVESARPIGAAAQRLVDKHLALARELGAQIIITQDEDAASALVRVAEKGNFAQVIVGQSRRRRWLGRWRRPSLADRLLGMSHGLEVHVVPLDETLPAKSRPLFDIPARSSWHEYALVLSVIIALTVLGMQLPRSYYVQIGLVYLLAINLLSLRVGRGPILTAGIVIALTWDYIFAPPYFEFGIDNLPDLVLFGTYFVVALIAGHSAARLRAQAHNERLREERATALFQFTRALAEAKNLAEAALGAVTQIDDMIGSSSAVAFADENNDLPEPVFHGSLLPNERERAAAIWAFRNRRVNGRFTETETDCAVYFSPLLHEDQAFGVLGVKLLPAKTLSLGQRDLLDAFTQHLALVVERAQLRAAGEREKLLAESEKLHHALLESVSHELRTPLAVIAATSEELVEAKIPGSSDLAAEIHEAALRLNRLVANLLDQTRLESGALRPHLDWCDPQDLINAAVESTRDAFAGRPLEISIPEDMPFVRADFALTEQVLVNLLLNAARHTPLRAPVTITTGIDFSGRRAFFSVADRGPGIPAALRAELFKKFSRGDAAPPGGLGLGLSIVHGFIAAQGGEVIFGDNSGGGAIITCYLPHTAPETPPPE